MNAKSAIFASLAANVLLLGATLCPWKPNPSKPDFPSPAVAQATYTSSAVVEKPVVVPAPTAGTAASQASTNTFDWRRVESADYRQYIANLRASGCPEKTIRDIIIADVNEMFRQRARSLSGSTNRFEYWKPGHSVYLTENDVTKQQELSNEKRELLRALLGDNAPTGLDPSTTVGSYQQKLEQVLDFLPADKIAPLMELEQKCGAKLMKTLKDAQQGDPEAMRKVMADKDAEMLQLLTPEQKFEYDLRMSQTAMVMRLQMGDFEPTEQQFRDMFKAQKAFDDQFGLAGMGLAMANAGKEEKSRRDAAQKELTAQLQNTLGEDGYRSYSYESRWAYDPLNRIAKDNNIPKDTAFKVFDLQEEARAEVAKARENQALSAEQRAAALAAMRAETEAAVGQVLGNEAAQAYFKKPLWNSTWVKRMGQ